MVQEEYRDAAQMCRNGIRKAKAWMKLSFARVAKNNKGFYRHIRQKRKAKDSVPPLMDEKGELVTTDMEKAEVLNFFTSVFTDRQASQVFVSLKP